MLIECSECAKQVSDKASACPNCGAPINMVLASVRLDSPSEVSSKKKSHVVAGTFGGLVFGFIILMSAVGAPKNAHEFVQILFMATPFILIGAVIGAFVKQ